MRHGNSSLPPATGFHGANSRLLEEKYKLKKINWKVWNGWYDCVVGDAVKHTWWRLNRCPADGSKTACSRREVTAICQNREPKLFTWWNELLPTNDWITHTALNSTSTLTQQNPWLTLTLTLFSTKLNQNRTALLLVSQFLVQRNVALPLSLLLRTSNDRNGFDHSMFW